MRVLQLVSCRGWSSDAYWAARMATELDRAGQEAILVCRTGSEARVIERARRVGASRIRTLAFASGVNPASDIKDLRSLSAMLREADVVHVHRGKEHWLAALASRRSATPRPLVRTRHIVLPIRPHALNRWLYGRATDLVVTVTEAIRGQIVAAGLAPPARVIALPGGVDAERFCPSADGRGWREALGVAPGVPVVGLIGGFRVMKGHALAVAAVARLRAEGQRFHLAFVGRGALEPRIREEVARQGLDGGVSFHGEVEHPEHVMAALDVALYIPLESDGMSRVLFEYLAAGVPVVASRVGVVPEVLRDGETALLVPAGEPEPLARAIGRLLADRPLAAALGVAGRGLVVSRLSGACVARRLLSGYEALAGAARDGRQG